MLVLATVYSSKIYAQTTIKSSQLDSLSRKAIDPISIMWQLQLEDHWQPVMSDHTSHRNGLKIRAVIPIKGKM